MDSFAEKTIEQESTRDEAINNPQTTKDFKGELFKINDKEVVLKNSSETFVKINGDVYENIEKVGNLSLYSILPKSDNYLQVGIERPITDIELKNYDYLNETPEKFRTTKDLLKGENPEELSC